MKTQMQRKSNWIRRKKERVYKVPWQLRMPFLASDRVVYLSAISQLDQGIKRHREEMPFHYPSTLSGTARVVVVDFIFQSSFWSIAKPSEKYRVPIYPLPPHVHIASLISNIPHHGGTFVTTDEPILTCHYYPKSPKSTVYDRFYLLYILWVWTNIYDTYPTLQYCTEQVGSLP